MHSAPINIVKKPFSSFQILDINSLNTLRRHIMLNWALTFLIIAIIAGLLGLGGVAGTATNIAYILFVIFLILFVVSLIRKRV